MLARLVSILGLFTALVSTPQPVAAQDSIIVFAAASLRNALDDTNAAFTKAYWRQGSDELCRHPRSD